VAQQQQQPGGSPGGAEITSAYVRTLFRQSQQQKLASRAAASRQAKAATATAPPAAARAKQGGPGAAGGRAQQGTGAGAALADAAAEAYKLQQDRASAAKMRAEMDKGLQRLAEERRAWERHKVGAGCCICLGEAQGCCRSLAAPFQHRFAPSSCS
jgi:hypothetical protein